MTPASSASAQVAAATGHLWGSPMNDPSCFDLPVMLRVTVLTRHVAMSSVRR
jgi:hypothetical protein